MKKSFARIIVALALGLVDAPLMADYLYAWVDHASDIYNNGAPITFDYVTVKGNDGSGWSSDYLYYYTFSGNSQVSSPALQSLSSDNTSTGMAYFDIGTEGYYQTFLFELWTSTGENSATRKGWQTYTLANVSANIFSSEKVGAGNTAFAVTSVIPEPTSGILLLLGMAGLALRRRKA